MSELHITVEQHQLDQALSTVTKATATSAPFNCVRLSSIDGKFKLWATDLDISIEAECEADIHEPGITLLPGKELSKLIAKAPPVPIGIKVENNVATVSWEGSEYRFNASKGELPEAPGIPDQLHTVYRHQLIAAIDRTAFAVSDDESMPIISGIYLMRKDDILHAIGTDGYRIAHFHTESEGREFEGVIPTKKAKATLSMMKSHAVGEYPHVWVSLLDDSFWLRDIDTDTRIVTLEGQYPDVLSMVGEPQDQATVDAGELREAIERVAVLGEEYKGGAKPVRLNFDYGITVSSSSPELGEAEETVSADLTSQGSLIFNSSYLLDGLKHLNGEVTIQYDLSREDPMRMGDRNWDYCVLPMKERDQ